MFKENPGGPRCLLYLTVKGLGRGSLVIVIATGVEVCWFLFGVATSNRLVKKSQRMKTFSFQHFGDCKFSDPFL